MSNFFLDIILCRIIFVAGSGKSVLWFVSAFMNLSGLPTSSISSTIIEDIKAVCEDGQASMGYFDFDFRDVNKQHLHDLISSLLVQLSDIVTMIFYHAFIRITTTARHGPVILVS